MTYLRSTWYAAAWSDEIARAPFSLVLLDEEVLFFRREDGPIAATSNRCPHRFVELHRGTIVGDHIQCPYHGLRFDSSGACVLNPHGDKRLPSKRLKTYRVEERDGIVWIRMGDPAKADGNLIPDFSTAAVEKEGYRLIKEQVVRDIRCSAPSNLLLELTVGRENEPRHQGAVQESAHLLTRASQGSTHYPWTNLRNCKISDAAFDAFLASDQASFITGVDLPVDGGSLAQA